MPKERGNNENTYIKRPDGRWEARISLGYENGKRKRVSYYGKTKAEVQKKAEAAKAIHAKGLPVIVGSETVGAFLNSWLADVAKVRVRPSTYRSYEQIVRNHLIPGLGRIKLDKLTPHQVTTFLRERHESGISVAHLHRVLRTALSQALKWDKVPRNVASLAAVPKREAKPLTYLDEDQVLSLFGVAKGDRLSALFVVATTCGLRSGELLGLRWEDVDLDDRVLYVRRQLQRTKEGLRFVEPKTRSARRSLPLPDFVVVELRAHRTRQEEEARMNEARWKESGLVFTTSIGTPLDARNVRRSRDALLERANLPKLRLHDLRHTCATLLASNNASARTIMEVLGHSTITLTMNTYAHVLPAAKREAADLMNGILGKGETDRAA